MSGELLIEGNKVTIPQLIDFVTRSYANHGGVGFAPRMQGPIREALWDYITSNPVYQQYTQRISSPTRQYNNEPWHAVGERAYAAWLCLAASTPGFTPTVKVHGLKPDVDRGQLLLPMSLMILGATPYLWCDKMEKLADAAPLPKHTVSPTVMPSPIMFWSRETAYTWKDSTTGESGENNWICVFMGLDSVLHTVKTDPGKPSPGKGRIFLVGDWVTRGNKAAAAPTNESSISNQQADQTGGIEEVGLVSFSMALGKLWPDDYVGDAQTGIVLKRCAFLNSPYVGANIQRLAHHHRRQMARAGFETPEVEEKIHVVKLRRPEKSKRPEPLQPGSEGVEWQHHWWVAGHYRAQWYPTEEAHRVIWIAPFLKGPEDKPLLEKVYAVVQ